MAPLARAVAALAAALLLAPAGAASFSVQLQSGLTHYAAQNAQQNPTVLCNYELYLIKNTGPATIYGAFAGRAWAPVAAAASPRPPARLQ